MGKLREPNFYANCNLFTMPVYENSFETAQKNQPSRLVYAWTPFCSYEVRELAMSFVPRYCNLGPIYCC